MSTPFEVSDAFTDSWADMFPVSATTLGVVGRDHMSADLSPERQHEAADLYKTTRAELVPHLENSDPVQSLAARVLVAELDERIALHNIKKYRRDLNHIASPFQDVRDVFDVMPRRTAEDWENIRSRLNGFAKTLDGYRRSLEEGVAAGDTVALRQAESVLSQVETAASDESMFLQFVDEAASVGVDAEAIMTAVDSARSGCADLATWLREFYLPAARPGDAVGEEEYVRGAAEFLGMDLDPHETYDWGWDEIHRIRAEMVATSSEIDSELSLEEVVNLLKTDPDRSAATREEFTEFVSALQQDAIKQLDGEHFAVPDELKVVTVNIAPPGVPLGAWYHGPSEDFSRSGSIWYAPGERQRLPYWQEVSTGYHEGFPGHHLQVGTAVLLKDQLSRFHRVGIWKSGSGEGWALYAERLMDELGFFEKPEYRLGLLASQLFRSIRVVVDIGCQLEKTIPDHAPMHAGDIWNYDRAVDYMNVVGMQPRDVSESEVKRYLGWFGQAISYKVGEREILKMREQVMAQEGAAFDRKGFHRRVLEAGAIRLDQLWEEVA
jgi:uncharacterized protein (DUF885 family)